MFNEIWSGKYLNGRKERRKTIERHRNCCSTEFSVRFSLKRCYCFACGKYFIFSNMPASTGNNKNNEEDVVDKDEDDDEDGVDRKDEKKVSEEN